MVQYERIIGLPSGGIDTLIAPCIRDEIHIAMHMCPVDVKKNGLVIYFNQKRFFHFFKEMVVDSANYEYTRDISGRTEQREFFFTFESTRMVAKTKYGLPNGVAIIRVENNAPPLRNYEEEERDIEFTPNVIDSRDKFPLDFENNPYLNQKKDGL